LRYAGADSFFPLDVPEPEPDVLDDDDGVAVAGVESFFESVEVLLDPPDSLLPPDSLWDSLPVEVEADDEVDVVDEVPLLSVL